MTKFDPHLFWNPVSKTNTLFFRPPTYKKSRPPTSILTIRLLNSVTSRLASPQHSSIRIMHFKCGSISSKLSDIRIFLSQIPPTVLAMTYDVARPSHLKIPDGRKCVSCWEYWGFIRKVHFRFCLILLYIIVPSEWEHD